MEPRTTRNTFVFFVRFVVNSFLLLRQGAAVDGWGTVAVNPPTHRPMQFGIDRLIADPALRAPLAGRRVALLAHPASLTQDLTHSLDALAACPEIKLGAAFGPQHGLRGDKQDNMVETADYADPALGIPVFSLYGEVRRPTEAMLDAFDVILVDLQDLGCRIYTFVTTLRYVLEAAAARSGRADRSTSAVSVRRSEVVSTSILGGATSALCIPSR